MAYKDILVYLDPTAESNERLKFAAQLAKTSGARLIGVDASASTGALAADEGAVTKKDFLDITSQTGIKAVFARATPSPIASILSSRPRRAARRATWSSEGRSTARLSNPARRC
jgi:hypothetical protein